MPRLKNLNKTQERFVREAVRALEDYLDPKSYSCAVSRGAREESKLYLETWVLRQLRQAFPELYD